MANMTGRYILSLLLLLLVVLIEGRKNVDPCVNPGVEVSLVWRVLCEKTTPKRVDKVAEETRGLNSSGYVESVRRSSSGKVTTTSTTTTSTQRPKVGQLTNGVPKVPKVTRTTVRPKQKPKLKVPRTTSRPKSDRKIVEDKKMGAKSRAPNRPTRAPQSAAAKTLKDKKKSAAVNLKNLGDKATAEVEKTRGSGSRQHKAFFVNYPTPQQIYQDKDSKPVGYPSSKKPRPKQKPKQKQKQKPKESDIYFIRLPPTPYSYVPGLGYISQPPTFSTSSLAAATAGQRPRPHHHPQPQPQNPFIKLPIDFVSNGKPTAVYRWPSKDHQPHQPPHQRPHHQHHPKHQTDSPIIRLNRGPYVFDGRPTSVYLMKRDPRPPIPNLY